MVEHLTRNFMVEGSSPTTETWRRRVGSCDINQYRYGVHVQDENNKMNKIKNKKFGFQRNILFKTLVTFCPIFRSFWMNLMRCFREFPNLKVSVSMKCTLAVLCGLTNIALSIGKHSSLFCPALIINTKLFCNSCHDECCFNSLQKVFKDFKVESVSMSLNKLFEIFFLNEKKTHVGNKVWSNSTQFNLVASKHSLTRKN